MSLPQQRLFLCSWPRCLSAAAGCTYTGVVATVAPPGRTRCRNGEVWTSPCRESPRLPLCSQHSGGTSSPKADGLYKSCWRKAAPLAGRLLPGVRAWGRFQAIRTPGPASVPAPGRAGRAGPIARALPAHEPPPDRADDTDGSSRKKEKGNLFSEKRNGKRVGTRQAEQVPTHEREGENQAKPGVSPSHRQKRGFSTFWGKPCKITRNLIKSTVQMEHLFQKRGKRNGPTVVKARI